MRVCWFQCSTLENAAPGPFQPKLINKLTMKDRHTRRPSRCAAEFIWTLYHEQHSFTLISSPFHIRCEFIISDINQTKSTRKNPLIVSNSMVGFLFTSKDPFNGNVDLNCTLNVYDLLKYSTLFTVLRMKIWILVKILTVPIEIGLIA